MKITKDLSVWKDLRKNFIKANKAEGRLGWFAEDVYGPSNDNLQMAQVAAWNEEGTEIAPERPVMRVGLMRAFNAGVNKANFKMLVEDVTQGKSPLKALRVSGEAFKDTLREAMEDWNDPGNAAYTIEQKGFDNPWINTSELMANVNYKVED